MILNSRGSFSLQCIRAKGDRTGVCSKEGRDLFKEVNGNEPGDTGEVALKDLAPWCPLGDRLYKEKNLISHGS